MSDPTNQGYPRNDEDATAFLNGLTFDDTAPVPELPPTADEIETGMVTTSVKLPAELRQRVKATAAEHCITASMLIRQYIEMGLAAEDPNRMIRFADVVRVLSSLPETA
ncbi:CopG family transcriptional regulator [Nocardia sp. NPDC046763]|uniref:CopG family transcriptional regulator n=1 Tax=Nocardia sp. NPDC046763 TaxID=3155256 RepID=UPI0033C7DC58